MGIEAPSLKPFDVQLPFNIILRMSEGIVRVNGQNPRVACRRLSS